MDPHHFERLADLGFLFDNEPGNHAVHRVQERKNKEHPEDLQALQQNQRSLRHLVAEGKVVQELRNISQPDLTE